MAAHDRGPISSTGNEDAIGGFSPCIAAPLSPINAENAGLGRPRFWPRATPRCTGSLFVGTFLR